MFSGPFFMWIGIYNGQTDTNAKDGDPTYMAGASLFWFCISCAFTELISGPANIYADRMLLTFYFLLFMLYDGAVFVQAR